LINNWKSVIFREHLDEGRRRGRVMNTSQALKIVRALADGVDPFTGEKYGFDSPYQNPDMIRALFLAVKALESREQNERRRSRLPENAGKPWSDQEDSVLARIFDTGASVYELAKRHKRTTGSIRARLEKLGKIESVAR